MAGTIACTLLVTRVCTSRAYQVLLGFSCFLVATGKFPALACAACPMPVVDSSLHMGRINRAGASGCTSMRESVSRCGASKQ